MHNDEMTSSQLAGIKFSGTRINAITREFEIWVYGEVVRRVSEADYSKDPTLVQRVYQDYFLI